MFVVLEAELPSHQKTFYIRIDRAADTTSYGPKEKKPWFNFSTFPAVDRVRKIILPVS